MAGFIQKENLLKRRYEVLTCRYGYPTLTFSNLIMNHDSGFIIGIALLFFKNSNRNIHLKATLKNIFQSKISLKFFSIMIIGPLVSIK